MMIRLSINIFYITSFFILIIAGAKASSEPKNKIELPKQNTTRHEGSMSLEKMDKIIKKLDSRATYNSKGQWRFNIEKVPVMIISDKKSNRMRILVPIRKADQLSTQELKRIMQANFDSVLDSRYAIAKNILWAVYIHPLTELHEKQFISAIGQTVNTALTYGTTYTSGAVVFGGGDSNAIIRRQLIDKLIKKGLKI